MKVFSEHLLCALTSALETWQQDGQSPPWWMPNEATRVWWGEWTINKRTSAIRIILDWAEQDHGEGLGLPEGETHEQGVYSRVCVHEAGGQPWVPFGGHHPHCLWR